MPINKPLLRWTPRGRARMEALAKATHSLFYLLMLGVPLAGWAMHSLASGGQSLTWFQQFGMWRHWLFMMTPLA